MDRPSLQSTPAIAFALIALASAAPAQAQDFLGGILRGAAERVASSLVDQAVDGAVSAVSGNPQSAPAAPPSPAPAEAAPPPRPPSGRPQVNYEGTAAERETFRLRNMQARGLPPPTGWYVPRADLTREQNCQAMTAANQWTQARSENPCRPR